MKKMVAISAFLILFGLSTAVGQGKFSGYMFGDYYYNVARDASIPTTNIASPAGTTAFQAFQLRRIYFTYDNDISEQFATRFRLEADQAAATSAPTASGDVLPSGKVGVFVKDAYLLWKNVFSGSNLIFGVQPTPAYDVSEAAWGYRSLEDYYGFARDGFLARPRNFPERKNHRRWHGQLLGNDCKRQREQCRNR